MKKNILTLPLLGLAFITAGLSSCSKDDIEIIEQDTSWTIDNKYEDEDIRNTLGEIPSTPLAYFNINSIQGNGIHELGKTTVQYNTNRQIEVILTTAIDFDLEIGFNIDSDKLSPGFTLMPEEAYTINPVTIPAGELKVTTEIAISNPDILQEGSYELPIKMVMESSDKIKSAKERGNLNIKCNIQFSIGLLDQTTKVLEGELYKNFVLTSNKSKESLKFLTDGNKSQYDDKWNQTIWKTTSKSDFLHIDLGKEIEVKGLKINQDSYYPLEFVKVYSNINDEVKFLGLYKSEGKGEQNIVFKPNTKLTNIILKEFVGGRYNYANLTELEVIK